MKRNPGDLEREFLVIFKTINFAEITQIIYSLIRNKVL